MGRFSTTVQIKTVSDNLSFINSFCEMMKRRGWVRCSEDEAAVSYILAFGGGWAALANEEYSYNLKKAREDSRKISEAMKTSTFSVEVVDSDFAVLTLNDGDTIIVGDGSGYGLEEPAHGTRSDWEPLLADGKTWEELLQVCEQDNVFVEDTLSELAEIFGMDPEYICADHIDLSEDEDATQLHFKKQQRKANKLRQTQTHLHLVK